MAVVERGVHGLHIMDTLPAPQPAISPLPRNPEFSILEEDDDAPLRLGLDKFQPPIFSQSDDGADSYSQATNSNYVVYHHAMTSKTQLWGKPLKEGTEMWDVCDGNRSNIYRDIESGLSADRKKPTETRQHERPSPWRTFKRKFRNWVGSLTARQQKLPKLLGTVALLAILVAIGCGVSVVAHSESMHGLSKSLR